MMWVGAEGFGVVFTGRSGERFFSSNGDRRYLSPKQISL